MTENSTSLEPFVIAVPGEDLADLTRRLKATRWARDPLNEDQTYGISTSFPSGKSTLIPMCPTV